MLETGLLPMMASKPSSASLRQRGWSQRIPD